MIHKIKNKLLSLTRPEGRPNESYSQCGEDLIMRYLLYQLGINNPHFIDIGAHHPKILSNTYLFYRGGATGVNIEPDPELIAGFYKTRPRDINLHAGVSFDGQENEQDFFIMTASPLNTFSREEVERITSYGTHKLRQTVRVKTLNINNVLCAYPAAGVTDLISIDIEGLDFAVISQIDFSRYRPRVICVETLSYTEDKSDTKNTELITYLENQGYMVYADTFINTIFVNRYDWDKR